MTKLQEQVAAIKQFMDDSRQFGGSIRADCSDGAFVIKSLVTIVDGIVDELAALKIDHKADDQSS